MQVLILGDICPTDVTAPLFKGGDTDTLFGNTLSLFEGKDFAVANVECALTDYETSVKKYGPPLKGPVETLDVLKKIGVDCCNFSNNHIFDFGIQGMKDTFRRLEELNLSYTGFGDDYEDSRKNFVFEKDGQKIAIVAVCEHEYSYALEDRMGSRPFDEFDSMLDVRKAKEECDKVIVLYHGGKEFSRYPSPRLRRVCRAFVNNGADVVLCQHSHCIGCYENFEGGHILYGQGNFHFVGYGDYGDMGWGYGFAVVYDTDKDCLEFIPVKDVKEGITLVEEDEKKKILEEFEARNKKLQNGEWKDGWHKFCESVQAGYLRVIEQSCKEDASEWAHNCFGHYLDCEAHTDVWRELFPSYNLTNEK